MSKQLVRIAPWQAGKVCAVIYFVLGLLFSIPFALLALISEPVPGEPRIGFGFAIALPLIYAICGLIFVPIACWVYNFAAKLVGGIEVEVAPRE